MGKTHKKSENLTVVGTGDWSSASKLSSIKNGYWSDPIFQKFHKETLVPNRAPLICHGYFVRFRLTEYFMNQILHYSQHPLQIVSLGSGLDSTFFRLHPQFSHKILIYVEVDFPSVISRKTQIIENDDELKCFLNEGKYKLVGEDIRNLDSLTTTLELNGVKKELPILFYSECVVNYLQPIESDNILKWISGNFPLSFWFAYEQCFPSDSFGKIMVNHFSKNSCPISSIHQNGTMDAQLAQLIDSSFKTSYVLNVYDTFLKITKDEEFPVPQFPHLGFDEHEAFIATCLHYSLRFGKTQLFNLTSPFLEKYQNNQNSLHSYNNAKELKIDNISNFLSYNENKLRGQSSVIGSNKIYLVGGADNSSKFVPYLQEVEINNLNSKHLNLDQQLKITKIFENEALGRLYSSAILANDKIITYGGRKSPTSPPFSNICEITLSLNGVNSSFYISKNFHIISSSSPGDGEKNWPIGRWRHAAAYLRKDEDDKMMIFGGISENGTLDDAWLYSLNSKTWTKIEKNENNFESPSERHSHVLTLCTNRESIFMTGGICKDGTNLCPDSIWEYFYNENKWTRFSSGENCTISSLARRVGHKCLIYENNLILVGGYGKYEDFGLDSFISIINLTSKEYQVYNLVLESSQIFLPFDLSCQIIKEGSDDFLVVLNGGGNCFSFGSHYNSMSLLVNLKQLTIF